MSKTNRNFIIAYILLVGLPILGLLGVLKSGRHLIAPISVDGVWRFQADPSQLAALPCGQRVSGVFDSAVVISQSGRSLALSLNGGAKSTGSGLLDGRTLKAVAEANSDYMAETGCRKDQVLSLAATVNPNVEPRSLSGILSVQGCPSCAQVAVTAVRQTAAIPKREGH